MSVVIQSQWTGARLPAMQRLCINSYLHHGHEFHLYTYGAVEGISTGAVVKNAREIMPEKNKAFPDHATFADFFRYKLLLKKGSWWVDMDTVCLCPFDFTDDFVFAAEDSRGSAMFS